MSGSVLTTLDYPVPTVSPEVDALLLGSNDLPAQLRRAVDESTRLLSASGAILYLLDESGSTLRWAYDAGIRDADELAWVRSLSFAVGVGLFGRSISEGPPMSTPDYRTDARFVHSPLLDRFVEDMDVRSMAVAPLIGAAGPLGALGVFSHEPNAYDSSCETLLSTLAQHAALAIDNAHLIDQLARSGEALSRRASAERSLRQIAARVTAIRDPAVIARQVVDESHRLLSSDCALLALVTGNEIHSAVVAGEFSPEVRTVVTTQRLQVRGSLLEAAVTSRTAVTATDYLADVVGRESGHNVELAEALGIRGMAVAPLRVEDRVVGLLGVWNRRPRRFDADELELLQGMADVAAIAVDNARLTLDLRTSEERFRSMTEHSPDIVAAVDRMGVLTYVSGRSVELTGWAPEEAVGRRFDEMVHPDARAVSRATWLERQAHPTAVHQFRLALLHRNGQPVPVEVRTVGIIVDGQLVGSQASIRDMRERDRLERELRRQEGEIAASHERAKLAQELHDSVTQALFSMTLTTRSAEMLLERDPSRVGEKLAELRDLAADALAEMRGLIFELRPGGLDKDGLVTALRKHAAAVQGRTGIPVLVDAHDVERTSPEVEEALYRIAQEALHNVVKHARASEARIELDQNDARVRLAIIDNGRGFDPGDVESGRLGLEGMRARSERIGARLSVESRPGAGTRVVVEAPADVRADPAAEGGSHPRAAQ